MQAERERERERVEIHYSASKSLFPHKMPQKQVTSDLPLGPFTCNKRKRKKSEVGNGS